MAHRPHGVEQLFTDRDSILVDGYMQLGRAL
jgi:hypothetical protein